MPADDLESRGGKTREQNSLASYAIEDRESQWTSWLIPLCVVANVAVFVVSMYINNCPKHNSGSEGKCVARFLGRFSFQPLRDNPLFGPSSSTLEKLGALGWTKVVHKHQGWRLITCIWLHAGVIHLLANMLSLAFIGIRLEQQFGFDFPSTTNAKDYPIVSYFSTLDSLPDVQQTSAHICDCVRLPNGPYALFVRIGTIYLLSGFGGSILSSLFLQHNISVGASGALFGVLGAMLSELITNWTIYTNKVITKSWFLAEKAAPLLTLLVIIIINLALGILPHVDNFAHIGGFLTGFLLGFVLLPRPQFGWIERRNLPADVSVKSKYKTHQYVVGLVSLILLIAGLTVGLVMLFRGVDANDHCHWCHYLSCVPTSKWKCDGT